MIKRGYTRAEVSYIARLKSYNLKKADTFYNAKYLKKVYRNKTLHEFYKTM